MRRWRSCAPWRAGSVELPRANECCGFGGTFAPKNAETSSAILDDKLDAVMETSAEVVAAVDMSCLMQIGGGLSRRGAAVRSGTSPRSWLRHEQGVLGGRARGSPQHAAQAEPARRDDDDPRQASRGLTAERPDWEELRAAGEALKRRVLRHLDHYLLRFESAVTQAGGVVHWARDAQDANEIVVGLVRRTGAREVVKVKSLTTDEIGVNGALAAAGVRAVETDLAELICQLAGDTPSHILVPAIHKNRVEIRDLFRRELGLPELSDEPRVLAAAALDRARRSPVSPGGRP